YIDALLSRQLNVILHAPGFQRLEAVWRGLYYLVSHSKTGPLLTIRVLNVSKDDLWRDLWRAPALDQSALFHKVYREEYGTFGGEPFGVLIGDYEFGRSPQDVALLQWIAQVAAAAQVPFIAAASPRLFGLESFPQLHHRRRALAALFDPRAMPPY